MAARVLLFPSSSKQWRSICASHATHSMHCSAYNNAAKPVERWQGPTMYSMQLRVRCAATQEHTHTFCNNDGDVRELDFRFFLGDTKIGAPFHGTDRRQLK